MSENPPAHLLRTTRLCDWCERLFLDKNSIQFLFGEDGTLSRQFAELSKDCSVCQLFRRCDAFSASLHGTAQGGTTENHRVEMQFLTDSGDHYSSTSNASDDLSTFDFSNLASMICSIHDETGQYLRQGLDLRWCSIPGTLLNLFEPYEIKSPWKISSGDTKTVRPTQTVNRWPLLSGFHTHQKYWASDEFVKPIIHEISECRQNHKSCGAKSAPVLPSLVLDLSLMSSSQCIQLYEPANGETGDYIALSYCWGGPQRVLTTTQNRAQHQAGISVQMLPRTIVEAVQIAASLETRYLWIDALCIVQNDEMAKALEIEKMGDIYANATLVLLAGGDSQSVNTGFLAPWDDIATVPIVDPSTGNIITAGLTRAAYDHLETRGWTMQERRLASRVLEFQGSNGVGFSCSEISMKFVAGIGSEGQDSWEHVEKKASTGFEFDTPQSRHWHEILQNYSLRSFTSAEDRLPGLAGVARAWAREYSLPIENYAAGLWKHQIINDLMWRRSGASGNPKINLDQYREPGWSWMSVLDHDELGVYNTNTILYAGYSWGSTYEETVASMLDCSVTLAHPEAPFGRLLGGSITIRAQVIALRDSYFREGADGLRRTILERCDYDLSPKLVDDIAFMRLKWAAQHDVKNPDSMLYGNGGLLLLPLYKSGIAETYRRVGIHWFWDNEDDLPTTDWETIDLQDVTLI